MSHSTQEPGREKQRRFMCDHTVHISAAHTMLKYSKALAKDSQDGNVAKHPSGSVPVF